MNNNVLFREMGWNEFLIAKDPTEEEFSRSILFYLRSGKLSFFEMKIRIYERKRGYILK